MLSKKKVSESNIVDGSWDTSGAASQKGEKGPGASGAVPPPQALAGHPHRHGAIATGGPRGHRGFATGTPACRAPSRRLHEAKAGGVVGGWFDSIDLDDAIRKAGLKVEDDPAPRREIDSFLPALLPPTPVLELLHTEKRVSVEPDKIREAVAIVRDSFLTDDGDKDLKERLLRVCSTRDLTYIGTMLSEHSRDGRPLAFKILAIAAGLGDKDAKFKYAMLISIGFAGYPRNVEKARSVLEDLADNSQHPYAMYVLALEAVRGGSIPDGMSMLEQAAELGLPVASAQLGYLYRRGGAVKKDPGKAVGHLKKASDAGIVEATFLLGTHYESGEGMPGGPDRMEGFKLYLAAANKGLAVAQHNVGSIYMQGYPPAIPKNEVLGLEYWKMAAAQNLQLSLVNLGRLHLIGLSGEGGGLKIDQDLVESRRYLQHAVDVDPGTEFATKAKELLKAVEQVEKCEVEMREEGKSTKRSWCSIM
ncbi:hypothetical protein HK101_004948 [Irineochytrium annulatum]|nr:hypothetical protein HK101_004948 [Irineochytrium annulatum]